MKKDFFNNFNESRGVALNKRKILKNRNSKCLTYLQGILIISLIIIFVSILLCRYKFYSISLLYLLFLYLLVEFFRIYLSYLFRRENDFKNVISFSKDGLTDNSFKNVKIHFEWNKILGVVIKNKTITFLTDTNIYFFFTIDNKDKILKLLKKYDKLDLIIE